MFSNSSSVLADFLGYWLLGVVAAPVASLSKWKLNAPLWGCAGFPVGLVLWPTVGRKLKL